MFEKIPVFGGTIPSEKKNPFPWFAFSGYHKCVNGMSYVAESVGTA